MGTKWGEIKTTIGQKISDTKTDIVRRWGDIKTAIGQKINDIKFDVGSKWNGIVSTISGKASSILNACTQPFKDAWNFIKNIPTQIVNAFKNMHITIPTPKLPHINVSYGSFLGVQYPKFSISWWAKGGFFDRASMIGVGEAGKEAVLPLENKRNMKPYAQAVASLMNDMTAGGGQSI